MAESTMTSKGQMTVPKSIRDRHHLTAGVRVEFVEEDGRIYIVPKTLTLDQLMKILPAPKRHVTLEEMDQAIRSRGRRSP